MSEEKKTENKFREEPGGFVFNYSISNQPILVLNTGQLTTSQAEEVMKATLEGLSSLEVKERKVH